MRWRNVAACLAVSLDALRLEITVDDTTEFLDFDRCSTELELVGIAHAFVHRTDRTLLATHQDDRAASQEIVNHMTQMQADATGPPCAAAPLPAGELPPVWTWADARSLATQGKLRLNFGGGAANDFHAFDTRYTGWVAVEGPNDPDGHDYGFCLDGKESCGKPWCLCRDLTRERFPLDDGSVASILTEHALEHIKWEHWPHILREFHRILRVGGIARVALPDYHSPGPSYRPVFWNATVAAEHRISGGHHAFPTFLSVRPVLETSPFEAIYWLHYWDGSALDGRPPSVDEPLPFVMNPIDYGLGWVKRTQDHPPENDANATSLVVDLVKLAGRQ